MVGHPGRDQQRRIGLLLRAHHPGDVHPDGLPRRENHGVAGPVVGVVDSRISHGFHGDCTRIRDGSSSKCSESPSIVECC